MSRFRKLPLEVDAARWFRNGDHPDDGPPDREGRVVRYWRHPGVPGDAKCEVCREVMDVHGWIDTLEDGHRVCPGDWIVTGAFGERYPVKDWVFRSTFEAVDQVRRFVLIRETDVSGVSGEGVVVWGIQYPDGYVAYRWNSATATTCLATAIADVEKIHGHDGATRLLWLDTAEGANLWQVAERVPAGPPTTAVEPSAPLASPGRGRL